MSAAHVCSPQAPKRKRGPYKRHKDPAEVSANARAAAYKLVEHEGELIPVIEKARRIQGRMVNGFL
jgi:hypothetical protein